MFRTVKLFYYFTTILMEYKKLSRCLFYSYVGSIKKNNPNALAIIKARNILRQLR